MSATLKVNQTKNQCLTRVLKNLHQTQDFDQTFIAIEQDILNIFSAERVTIYQYNISDKALVSRYKTGDELKQINLKLGVTSIAGFVGMTQKSVQIDDVYDVNSLARVNPELQFDSSFDKKSGFRTGSMLVAPIEKNGALLGVFQLINKQGDEHFDEEDLKQAVELANFIGQKFAYIQKVTSSPFEYLVNQKVLEKNKLDEFSKQSKSITELAALILRHTKLHKADIGESLEHFFQVPFLSYKPEKYWLHPIAETINKSYLRENGFVVLTDKVKNVLVLIDDPKDTLRRVAIQNILGHKDCTLYVGFIDDITQYLGYSPSSSSNEDISSLLDELETDDGASEIEETDEIQENDSTIVRLVNRILVDAQRLNASDVHIEPSKGKQPMQVRMRVDGICQEVLDIPASYAKAVVSRIKIMARLDIAERRIPQDGKFALRLQGQQQEVRVATIPVVHGEGVVMRLLAAGEPLPFNKLNLSPENEAGIKKILTHPHGIFLVVGPTGSGKTTTLHAILSVLNTPEKKIWTAEDPVEITQQGLQQVQVNPKIGFDFSAALRSFLRADPDIILIGEMRDKETAHAAVEASLTGHLVMSTLHTNSAPETITRLLDLGIDPISFSDAFLGVLAQRLVRTMCSDCKKQRPARDGEVEHLFKMYGEEQASSDLGEPSKFKFFEPVGCDSCSNTGYRGRTSIHELLVGSDELVPLIYRQATAAELKEQATKQGMRSLIQDGIRKITKGQIDLEQLRNVIAS